MRDSSDDFFSNFGDSPPQQQRKQPPPPKAPRPYGTAAATTRRPSSNNNYVLNHQNNTPGQQRPPPPSHSQQSNSNTTQNTNYYGAAPLQQPIQYPPSPTQPRPPPPINNTNDGWYQPQPHAQQQQQQHYQPQPPLYGQQQQPPPPMMAASPSTHYQPTHAVAAPYNHHPTTFDGSMNNSNNSHAPSFLQGSMDGSDHSAGSRGGVVPVRTFVPGSTEGPRHTDEEDELPLLEELGINLEHIAAKTKAVILPFRRLHGKNNNNFLLNHPQAIVQDADLAGPLFYCVLLGGELILSGKIQFGMIYILSIVGCLGMTVLLNLMHTKHTTTISVWTVTSILGYSLLPVNVLAIAKVVTLGYGTEVLAAITVLWSTLAATRLLEIGCDMHSQRYLIAYPLALLYSAFVLITIF